MADDETTTEETTTTSTSTSSSERRPPILAVDMDETIIQSDTEELIPGARDALLALQKLGWQIVIWTCRGDVGGHTKDILDRHGIPYDAINENIDGIKDKSRKIVFDAVVDNKNVDFNDGWEAIVGELETRRKGWIDQGITKAYICEINTITGEEEIVQEWSLDGNGCAILTSGDEEAVELDLDVSIRNGVEFLKSIERSVSGTYLFARVA